MNEEKPVNYFEFRDVCKSFDDRLVLDHFMIDKRRAANGEVQG